MFWIPYHANSFPIPTGYLPKSTHWETDAPNEEMRLAARAMLATGNPTPPDAFPEAKDWQTFVDSNEYRGYAWYDLYACCPNEKPKLAEVKRSDAGYTPPSSEIPSDPADTFKQRLTDYHNDHQNIGSIATGLTQTPGGASVTDKPGKLAFPDRYRDAAILIKKLCPPTNESYSKGEKIGPRQVDTKDCLSGSWEFYVRVGKAHNLLNYALCGKLVRFQGGTLNFNLCCDAAEFGTLARPSLGLYYGHSAIPSWRLYINNQKVHEYDMLTAPWSEVEGCFYEPTPAGLTEWSTDQVAAALNEQKRSPPVKHWDDDFKITSKDGCSGDEPPDEWLHNAPKPL